MGLFKLEDIPRYYLVHELCDQDHFAERRFQFLVDMDPSSLVHTNLYGRLPLHIAALSSIQAFRIVFEYVIRYYPNQKGITMLFTKDNDGYDEGETPFQMVCQRYGREVVMTIVEDTLNNSIIPLNIVEAVVMAAIDGNVHLDCVYFLLRREPHVWVRLLSEPHNNSNNNNIGEDGGGNYNHGNAVDDDDNDNDNGDNDNDSDGGIVDSKNDGTGTRKRKRSVGSIDER